MNTMNTIRIKGRIVFDPKDKTKKHGKQSSWKKIAMIMFSGDICEYYSWFLTKRYSINLNMPLRGPHVSFINDSINDIMKGLNTSEKGAKMAWEALKKKWDGKEIEVVLNVSPESDGKHWWLMVPHKDRGLLYGIRNEVGMVKQEHGLHMTLGFAVDKYDMDIEQKGVKAKRMNIAQSEYILKLIRDKFIE